MFDVNTTLFNKENLGSSVQNDDMETSAIAVDPNAGITNISDLLNGLYKDTSYAVIREYLTNAKDAHSLAKTDVPIEVFLGNIHQEFRKYDNSVISGKTFFVVKDHGIGMSLEDIKNVYSKYGASTKTKDVSLVGQFGVGAKVALHLSHYFEVHSIKNGYKTVCVLDSNPNTNISTLHVKSHERTDEANGTTIKVPVPYSFVEKAPPIISLLTFSWKPNSVHLNGAPVENNGMVYDTENYIPIYDAVGEILGWVSCSDAKPINSTLVRRERRSKAVEELLSGNYIVGGVPYSITAQNPRGARTYYHANNTFYTDVLNRMEGVGYEIIINLPPKAVALTPSRENIKITDENIKYITHIEKMFTNLIKPAFLETFNSLPNKDAARKFYLNNWYIFNLDDDKTVDTSNLANTISHQGENIILKWNSRDYYDENVNYVSSFGLEPQNAPIVLNLIGCDKTNFFSSTLPYRHQLISLKTKNIIVYGEVPIKNNKPVNDYVKKNINYVLKSQGYDTRNVFAQYIWFQTPKAPPAWISEEYPQIRVLSVTELAEIAREYRRNQAKLRATTPPTEKTVRNSYYISVSQKGDMSEIELLDKTDIKTRFTAPVYYLQEENTTPMRYKEYNKTYTGNWEKIRLSKIEFQPVTFEKTKRDHDMTFFPSYYSLAEITNKPLILIPKERSVDAFLKLNPENLKPYNEFTQKAWENLSEKDKIILLSMIVLRNHSFTENSFRRNVTPFRSSFSTEALEEYVNKVDNVYVKEALLNLYDPTNYLTKLLPAMLLGDTKDLPNKMLNRIGMFDRYLKQLHGPDPEVLSAIADLSELKA